MPDDLVWAIGLFILVWKALIVGQEGSNQRRFMLVHDAKRTVFLLKWSLHEVLLIHKQCVLFSIQIILYVGIW